MNKGPTGVCVMLPKSTIVRLGGMRIPNVDAHAMIAVENPCGYPALRITGKPNDPTAAASAAVDPVIPAKNMQVSTVADPVPPGTGASMDRVSSTSGSRSLPRIASSPAMMNSGIASNR